MDVSSFVSFFTRKSLSLDRPLSLLYRGILGQLDSFIGPGATAAEVILQFGAAFIIGYGCLLVYHENVNNRNNKKEEMMVFLSLIKILLSHSYLG